jgi:hypothetical protein
MQYLNPGWVVPIGAFIFVIILVAIKNAAKTRERELAAHQELRTREMEHEKRLKEMELEKARIELEKARLNKSGDPVPR